MFSISEAAGTPQCEYPGDFPYYYKLWPLSMTGLLRAQ
jgi:hypothetical protein